MVFRIYTLSKGFSFRRIVSLFLFLTSLLGHRMHAQEVTTADSLFATGNYTKAINAYAEIGGTDADLQIARAYNAIGNLEKAVVQYQSLIEKAPNRQIASFELGKLFLKTKRYEEAKTLFSKLAVAVKDNPEYNYYLGEAYLETQQLDSANIAYKQAVATDSTHLRSLFRLGKYYMITRERDKALEYVDAGLRFYENDMSFINLKALILYNDAQYVKAIPLFEKLLEMGEIKPYVYEKLAYSYFKDWDFEGAKKNYRALIDMDDTNSDAYFGMAAALRKNKQLDSAEIYIRMGMDVQRPILAEGYASLASLARQREDLKSALEYYKLAFKEDPTDEFVYFNICTVADQHYKDPKTKLYYYQNYLEKFGAKSPYTSKIATKRIKELKEEIHFSAN